MKSGLTAASYFQFRLLKPPPHFAVRSFPSERTTRQIHACTAVTRGIWPASTARSPSLPRTNKTSACPLNSSPSGEDTIKPERIHCSVAPLATASSIVPTYKNADSGRSSCLPSKISRNPRIVSESGTYVPGKPVNFSDTNSGWDRKR